MGRVGGASGGKQGLRNLGPAVNASSLRQRVFEESSRLLEQALVEGNITQPIQRASGE